MEQPTDAGRGHPHVVAVDPGTSGYTGVAEIVDGELRRLATVRVGGNVERAYRERLHALCEPLPGAVLALEKPPDAAKRSANHGSQARIGGRLLYLGGMIAQPWVLLDMDPILVEVSAWRETLVTEATRRRIALQPSRLVRPAQQVIATRRDGDAIVLRWTDGQETTVPSLEHLEHARAPAAGDDPQMTHDEAKRDNWKRLACETVRAMWPERFEDVAVDCRARARTAKPDHRVEGIADACEAAIIALHVHGSRS